ncbi:hypothetical protein IFR05_010549 [Cadophora sp. M221]|nr:hypothetical protein IFR05_010549 [Cadophora sp. M221]
MASTNPSHFLALKLVHYLALACITLHLLLAAYVTTTSGTEIIDGISYISGDAFAICHIAFFAFIAHYQPEKFKGLVVIFLNALAAFWFCFSLVILSLYAAGVRSSVYTFKDLDEHAVYNLLVWLAVFSGLAGVLFTIYASTIAIILLRSRVAANSRRRRVPSHPVPVVIPLINLPRLPAPTIHHNFRLNNPYHPLGISPSNTTSHVPVLPREMV